MQGVDVISSYIQAIGYVVDDRLVCSSMGVDDRLFPLGPVDCVSPRGSRLRVHVTVPLARRSHFIVVERDGYAASIRTDLLLEATTAEADVSLGAVVVDAHGAPPSSTMATSWLSRARHGSTPEPSWRYRSITYTVEYSQRRSC